MSDVKHISHTVKAIMDELKLKLKIMPHNPSPFELEEMFAECSIENPCGHCPECCQEERGYHGDH